VWPRLGRDIASPESPGEKLTSSEARKSDSETDKKGTKVKPGGTSLWCSYLIVECQID
jgi:hypothetical protein